MISGLWMLTRTTWDARGFSYLIWTSSYPIRDYVSFIAVNSEFICVYLTCSSVNFLSFQSTRNLLKDDPLTDSGCKTRSIRFWNIDTVTQLSLELNRNCYSNLPSSDSHACAAFPCMWLIIWFVLTCHLQYNILIMYHKNTWPEQQHVYPDCLLKKTGIHPITS